MRMRISGNGTIAHAVVSELVLESELPSPEHSQAVGKNQACCEVNSFIRGLHIYQGVRVDSSDRRSFVVNKRARKCP